MTTRPTPNSTPVTAKNPQTAQRPRSNPKGIRITAPLPPKPPAAVEALPFSPSTTPLRDVLRDRYIKNVVRWLLGQDEESILAQTSNSLWESALTVIVLAEARRIFEIEHQASEFSDEIRRKSVRVARWMLSQKQILDPDGCFASWENVTWDTSVVVRGLLITLETYKDSFTEQEREEITQTALQATRWLLCRFSAWDTQVKYPFGPADVSQIVITILHLAHHHPDVYKTLCDEHYGAKSSGDICSEIIEYLLHRKTERTLTLEQRSDENGEIVAYWWDDYFSTAEVVEALALYYQHCQSNPECIHDHQSRMHSIKTVLIGACTFFEHGQIDGMWGSHIETIKVLYAYVLIRRMIPQRDSGVSEPLIVPEIHTTFKAVRWMCDEKQVFRDGSFLHTMFLTVFYALALVEVYRSWEPAQSTIEKIYDDVVWFSPVRTTPERSKRLAAELRNSQLVDDIERADALAKRQFLAVRKAKYKQRQILFTIFLLLLGAPLFLLLGTQMEVLQLQLASRFSILKLADFLQYSGVFVTVLLGVITLIWTAAPSGSNQP